MDDAVLKQLSARYDIEQLRTRASQEAVEAVRGFDAASVEVGGWRVSMTETLSSDDSKHWRRVVFDAVETPAMRVMIDVEECASPQEAVDALLERLAGNQLTRLEPGPSTLGFAVFQHPVGAPPAIFFARGNLCVTVASFGSRSVAVAAWAERVVEALVQYRPKLLGLR